MVAIGCIMRWDELNKRGKWTRGGGGFLLVLQYVWQKTHDGI